VTTHSQSRMKTAGNLQRLPAVGVKRRPAATILVVEDEHFLRIGVRKALQRKGFAVLEAGDGAAALRVIQAHLGDIDVVLLDVVIPEVSSREVLENLRRLRPGIKVILTSTYSKDIVDARFAGLPVERFIRKPFQLIDLFTQVGNALNAARN